MHEIEKDSFSQNLKRLRKQRGLTLEELAEKCNEKYETSFNKSMISKWENGYKPNLYSLKVLCHFFGVDLNDLVGFTPTKKNKENHKIPVVRAVSNDTQLFSKENIIEYAHLLPTFDIPEQVIKDLFYLKIKDDSMDLEYPNGSYVLVRRNAFIQENDNVVILVGDEKEAILRKVSFQDNIIKLFPSSSNDEFKIREIDTNKTGVRIIGKVIGSFKKV